MVGCAPKDSLRIAPPGVALIDRSFFAVAYSSFVTEPEATNELIRRD